MKIPRPRCLFTGQELKEKPRKTKYTKKIVNKGKLESQVEKEICLWLKSKKILFWKMKIKGDPFVVNGQIRFKKNPNEGFSDILCCIKGRFVSLEIKREKGGIASEKQIEMQRNVEAAGGIYQIVKSVAEVENWFYEYDLI